MRIELPFPLPIRPLCDALAIPLPRDTSPIRTITTDSRLVERGDLFVALRGDREDGHRYLGEAAARGARLLSEHRERDAMVVPDTRAALSAMAALSLALHRVPVIAVTGSVGKTGTKDAVAAALGTRYRVCKTKENLNNDLGVAYTVLSRASNCEILLVELGTDHRGEIAAHARVLHPNIAILTAIGSAHIGNFGSVEEILNEKADILSGMQDGILLLNADDPRLRTLISPIPVITVGIDHPAQYRARSTALSLCEATYTLFTPKGSCPVRLAAPGIPRIYASLFAMAVAEGFGISLLDAAAALGRMSYAKGRGSIEEREDLLLIDDSYNASPEAVRAGLSLLATVGKGRKRIAVLGDMLELGDAGVGLHREIGKEVAATADRLISFGRLAEEIAKGAREAGMPTGHITPLPDADSCIAYLQSATLTGTAVLIKASHDLGGDRIADAIRACYAPKTKGS